MVPTTLPYLDLEAQGFSTRGPEVIAAREAAWCARTHNGFAVLRHREAGLLLRDRRLRQGSHAWPDTVGISGSFTEFWKRSVIGQEGEPAKRLRQVVQAALAEDHVLSRAPDFEGHAESLLRALPKGPFDIVENVSEPFAGRAITTLLGLPMKDAAGIAKDAAALGLAMGPEAKDFEARTNAACDRLSVLAEKLLEAPPPGSLTARMLAAAAEIGVSDAQALTDLVVIAIFGGVDTTRAQLAFAALLFAKHPQQWAWLRENPDAAEQAIDEVIRMRPTTTWATRQVVEPFEMDGVALKAGEILYVLVHASGTDPAVGGPDGFDITARRKRHFGFGGGAHHCLGHFVAHTDMAAALRVMLRRWRRIDLVGEPTFLPDSGNTSPTQLVIAPDWA